MYAFKLPVLILCLSVNVCLAQVAINTDGSSADPSAMLDVKSTSKGMLIPRMTTTQRTTISAPANGMILFDTDTETFWFYNSMASVWQEIAGSGASEKIIDTDTDTYVTVEENPDDDIIRMFVQGTEKVRVGEKAIEQLSTGNSVFVGEEAGFSDDLSDNNNVFVGYKASRNNASGYHNTAVGFMVHYLNDVGYNNSAFGYKALFFNTSGSNNTAVGYRSMFTNSMGVQNVSIGADAMYSLTMGSRNLAIGYSSLYTNSQGHNNIAMGDSSLYNATSSNNIAVGVDALEQNTTAGSNIAIGTAALSKNTIQSNLVAIGDSALYMNGYGTTHNYNGRYNYALGSKAMRNNTEGSYNVAIGFEALKENISGCTNVAIGGEGALQSNTTGYDNIGIGTGALFQNTTGYRNIAIGDEALSNNQDGDENTAIGGIAASVNSTGNHNTAVGYWSLSGNNHGNNNTACGYYAAMTSGIIKSNTGAFGYNVVITASDQYRFGNTSVASIGGYVGWTNVSDGRFKSNLRENVPGLDFIMKLRPLTYNLDVSAINKFLNTPERLYNDEYNQNSILKKSQIVQTGFIAQEVEEAARELGYNFSGVDAPENNESLYGLRYAEFVVPLVKSIQELNNQHQVFMQKSEAQQRTIEKQNRIISEMIRKIDAMESSAK